MRLVFSKDRPAQLDLLLRSLDRYAPEEETCVMRRDTSSDFARAYGIVESEHPGILWSGELAEEAFQSLLDLRLKHAGETVTFFCDDDVLYRPLNNADVWALADSDVLTFSLRLGLNGKQRPTHFEEDEAGYFWWKWADLDPHDHGYPGSIDGHTFRTADVLRMIEGQTIPNPLILETVLARRVGALAAERPLMACYREQALVGVNVNSVADASRTAGQVFPQPAEELNRRFLAGERISLDALDFSGVDGCLVELPFEWERAA